MNENAKKWAAALRSGEYQQAKNFLTVEDRGHCCLGVACELAISEGVPLKRLPADGGLVKYIDETGDGSTMSLPEGIRLWLGLTASEGQHYDRDGTLRSLSWMNDNGVPFEEIANYIEDAPKGLFDE